jgi:acetyl/propionyl-CoA carboxylase alpha subunit
MIFDVTVNQRDYRVELEPQEDGRWSCRVNGETILVDAASTASGVLSLIAGGQSFEVITGAARDYLDIGGTRYDVEVRDPRAWRTRKARGGAGDGPKKIAAPMPGKVVRVIAPPGTEVEHGAGVIVIEAMKMQNELKSPKKGRVAKILASEGAAVNAGDVLAVVE